MTRNKDLTDSPAIKAKYEELWNYINSIDIKHADINGEWQTREVESVLQKLDSFHNKDNTEKYEYETKRLAQTIDLCANRIRSNINDADYLIINRLKDSIHKMWQTGFREDNEEYTARWDTDWYKQIDKLAQEIGLEVDRKKFYEVSKKIKMTVGSQYHSAESYEKNELLRLKVLGNALKQKIGDNAEDVLYLMIHDIYQNVDGCKFIGEDIQDIIQARELGIITELQFIRLMKLASEILPLYYYRGDHTWRRDSLESQWRFESDYVTDYLKWTKNHENMHQQGYASTWKTVDETEVRDKIACGRILCYNRINLTDADLYALNHGKKLDIKFCCKKCELGEK